MNAVATPTKAKPASASGKSSSAKANTTDQFTPAAIKKAAFGQVETLLNEAYMTDEDHAWSGDSDRLLDIAHSLADKAMIDPPIGPEMPRVAFNIAALIRASRLVPGDSESPQRKALIDQAAVHLNWLTESDMGGSDCCDPGVPRPAAPGTMHLAECSPALAKAAPRPLADCAAAAWFRAREAQAVLWASVENYSAPETVMALHTLVEISVEKLAALNEKISEEACEDASSILSQAIALAAFLAEDVNGDRWELLLDAALFLVVQAKATLDQGLEASGHA